MCSTEESRDLLSKVEPYWTVSNKFRSQCTCTSIGCADRGKFENLHVWMSMKNLQACMRNRHLPAGIGRDTSRFGISYEDKPTEFSRTFAIATHTYNHAHVHVAVQEALAHHLPVPQWARRRFCWLSHSLHTDWTECQLYTLYTKDSFKPWLWFVSFQP